MEYFVSRQPIFTTDLSILGYNLSFQGDVDTQLVEMCTLNSVSENNTKLNLSEIASKKLAFVNFNLDMLALMIDKCIDNEFLIIVVDAEIAPTARLLDSFASLHEQGVSLCLNNMLDSTAWQSIFPLIGYISYDINTITANDLFKIVDCVGKHPHIKLIATNVKEYADQSTAMQMGFSYFSGVFFAQTEILMSRAMSPAETTLAELLYQTSLSNVELGKVIEIVNRDVYLTYKILSYANTVFFRRREQVSSIKQAVVTLGLCELKRFISILFTSQLSQARSKELVRLSLYRGKFCESVIELDQTKRSSDNERAEAFLVGLLSLIEPMFREPAAQALKKLSLSNRITTAILDQTGELAIYLELAIESEKGAWDNVVEVAASRSILKKDLVKTNLGSMLWADQQMSYLKLNG